MTHVPSPAPAPTPAPDVVARHLPDGAVLVHLGTNAIFELNATGSRIWSRLAEGATRADIVSTLTTEFDIDAATADREVAELLGRLTTAGLVRP